MCRLPPLLVADRLLQWRDLHRIVPGTAQLIELPFHAVDAPVERVEDCQGPQPAARRVWHLELPALVLGGRPRPPQASRRLRGARRTRQNTTAPESVARSRGRRGQRGAGPGTERERACAKAGAGGPACARSWGPATHKDCALGCRLHV